MKTKMSRLLGAALLALMGLTAGRAEAFSSTATLNIDVTITALMSVSIEGVYAATMTTSWNGSVSSITTTSSVTVTNDSSIVTERWELSTAANSWPTGTGSGSWTINSSSTNLAADNIAVQAVFGSSNTALTGCNAVSTGTWNQAAVAPPLTTTPAQYTNNGTFASSELNAGGGSFNPDSGNTMYGNAMANSGVRALCWRLLMPPSTTAQGTQVVPIVVTAF